MAVEIFNPNVGISSVLPGISTEHLPNADDFNTIGQQANLGEVQSYKQALNANSFNTNIVSNFTPEIVSDDLLRPATFNNLLNSSMSKLAEIKDADVRDFLQQDLKPLSDNRELLNAYLGMMVEG